MPGRAAAIACLLAMQGCYAYRPASPRAAVPVHTPGAGWSDASSTSPAPLDWPALDTVPLRHLAEPPEFLPDYTLDAATYRAARPELTDQQAEEMIASLRSDGIHIRHTRLTDHGLLRLWSEADEPESPTPTRGPYQFIPGLQLEHFVRSGRFLTAPALAARDESDEVYRARGMRPPGTSTATGRPGLTRTRLEHTWAIEHGLELATPHAVPENAPGLVLHLTSLYENTFEHALLRRFRRWGWAVAHIETDIRVRTPNAAAALDRELERSRRLAREAPRTPPEWRERRRTGGPGPTPEERRANEDLRRQARERIATELPDPPTGFEIHPDDDHEQLTRLAARIADAADTRLAEHAYAAEALVAAIDELHPDLADRPIVVIGFSAGALAAPAVAARLHEVFPDRPLRVVLVGGGGDLLTMARTSTLTNGGITLSPADGPDPTPGQIETLQAAYESRVRLDPVKAVAALRAVPLLHIYASRDTIVPTAGAERVNEAHAHAARLVHRGDHDTLFFFLGSQAGRVRSWLRSTGVE
jgi:hypothetical protein